MEPENDNLKKPIKSLRTYAGDVEEALGQGKSSAATIMIAEQKRRENSPVLSQRPVNLEFRNKTFIMVGMSLLVLGLIVVGSVYYLSSSQKTTTEKNTKAVIAYTTEHKLDVASSSRDQIINKIISEKSGFKQAPNSVLYINTLSGNSELPVENLLALIAPRMPSSLARAFEDKYMVGIYSFDTNEPFIILTTKDYPSAYSGMLKWEKDMATDLGKIFQISPANQIQLTFADEALKNKDLRIMQNADKKTILLYSFIDKNTLIITTNENIFSAILGKYLINKQIR